jgi:hypothetical protein
MNMIECRREYLFVQFTRLETGLVAGRTPDIRLKGLMKSPRNNSGYLVQRGRLVKQRKKNLCPGAKEETKGVVHSRALTAHGAVTNDSGTCDKDRNIP